jgi:hypothetical protein
MRLQDARIGKKVKITIPKKYRIHMLEFHNRIGKIVAVDSRDDLVYAGIAVSVPNVDGFTAEVYFAPRWLQAR